MIEFTNGTNKTNKRDESDAAVPDVSPEFAHPPALACRHVSYRRPGEDAPVIDDVSLTVQRGEWVCLTGRNGSGKSTLLRLLAGMLPASAGTISIDGEPLSADTMAEARNKIGMVFASPDDQFIGLTVADDIAFGLENRGLPREEMVARIDRYAGLLGLEALLDRHPATLSGGQKQRAAMAAVLAMEPAILLLDEAGSMLDDQARADLRNVVQNLRKAGTHTVLSITHDPEEMALADRLIMLADGKILAAGKPEQLLVREDLLARCRIAPPATLAFCRELAKRGIDIGHHLDERKAVDALWASLSTTSRPDTGMNP